MENNKKALRSIRAFSLHQQLLLNLGFSYEVCERIITDFRYMAYTLNRLVSTSGVLTKGNTLAYKGIYAL